VQHETKVNTPPEAVETLEPDETPYSDCPRAVEFVLKDQFKEPHAFTLPAPKVTVLVFGDRKCSDDATPWSDALWKRYKDRIQYEGVGVGRWIPFFERPIARMMIRKATDFPIALDWNGKVAKKYRYLYKHINVFIIEPNGRIVRTVVGSPTTGNLDQVFETVDKLLSEHIAVRPRNETTEERAARLRALADEYIDEAEEAREGPEISE